MPNCEVSHTWGGGAAALGRSWLPPLMMMMMMMMMVTQWRRVKMDGRFISNRLIQTGSIGGKPDRTGGGHRTASKDIRHREAECHWTVGICELPFLSGRGMKLLPAERTTISHEAEFHDGRSPCSRRRRPQTRPP